MRLSRFQAVLKSPSSVVRFFFQEQLPGRFIAKICGGAVLLMAGLTMAGGCMRWHGLPILFPRIFPLSPDSTVGFLILGLALLLLSSEVKTSRMSISVSALSVVTIFLISVQWMMGRMPSITSVLFMVSAPSFLLLGYSLEGKSASVASLLAFGVFLLNLLILLGYLYQAPILYRGAVIPVTLSTAICFLWLSAGQMALTSQKHFPLCLVMGASAKSLLLRAFLPVSLAAVLVDGVLHNLLGGSWNPAWVSIFSGLVVAIFVVLMVSEVSVVVGGTIDQAEDSRDEAEEALKKSYFDLAQSNVSLEEEVSRRREAEQQTRRQLERLEALRSIDLAISSSLDARVTMNILVEVVTTQLKVTAAAIHLYDSRTNHLEYGSSRGFSNPVVRLDLAADNSESRAGKDPAWKAIAERHVVRAELETLNKQAPRVERLLSEGLVGYMGVPLIAKGHVRGLLELFQQSAFPPNAEWESFLETLVSQAAIALDNASLFEDLQRSNATLIETYDTTLEGWSKALDLRDHGTEGHSVRVAGLTVRVARAIGVDEEQLVHVRRGALLHDIGKMGIPDRILLKEGSLTPSEWEIMRKHPGFAFEMLSPIAYLRPALDIPYAHHERWDGAGYPRGLKGTQIPLSVRIFSVVDIWDALRSERPYHPAWPVEKVVEYLKTLAGSHLDPSIVETFLRMVPELVSAELASRLLERKRESPQILEKGDLNPTR